MATRSILDLWGNRRRPLGTAVLWGMLSLATIGVTVCAGAAPAGAVTCPTRTGLTAYNLLFRPGPSIPYTGSDYVSQGLAHWPSKDWIVTSHSDDTTNPMANILAIRNRATGAFVKRLYVKDAAGHALGGHMGGIAISRNYLWVSSVSGSKNLFRYSLSAIAAAPADGSVRAGAAWSVAASSYASYAGGYLYVGQFSDAYSGTALMYRYGLTSTESLAGPATAITTPTRVQGVAVADGHYIFSTSYGRDCYSRLKFRRIGSSTITNGIELPPMSEGIVNVPRGAAGPADDWLYVNFESGSRQYPDAAMRLFTLMRATTTALTP